MSKQSAIDSFIYASKNEQAKPPVFLNAWKDGVYLVGGRFFDIDSQAIGSATNLDQLRPNLHVIFQNISVLSNYERVFILSMCQFYCDSDVRDYCDEYGLVIPTLPDIANLDDKRRSVIMSLLVSYTGW